MTYDVKLEIKDAECFYYLDKHYKKLRMKVHGRRFIQEFNFPTICEFEKDDWWSGSWQWWEIIERKNYLL